jgi:hypothetical protein
MSTTTYSTDYCTLAPDSPFGFSFGAICAIHDDNYGPNSTVSRPQADQIFHEGMRNVCDTQYGGSALCHLMADVYFIGVRLFGGIFYEGPGGN